MPLSESVAAAKLQVLRASPLCLDPRRSEAVSFRCWCRAAAVPLGESVAAVKLKVRGGLHLASRRCGFCKVCEKAAMCAKQMN